MRRRSSISLALLAFLGGALIMSCENERLLFTGPYFIRFSETAMTVKESYLPPVSLEVHQAGPPPEGKLTITYSISGTARPGIDYVVLGTPGVITIERGKYFGSLQIQLINNANNILRQQDIIIQLETVDNDALQVGQDYSLIGKQFTLTILDDCILGGDYYGIVNAASLPTEGITITSIDCESYILSNWDIEVFNFPEVRDLSFIDNGDNTLTIPLQEESTLDDSQATIDGSGVVDPVTRSITMTIRLVDFENQPEFSFKLIPN